MNNKFIITGLFLISTSILCFEIVATRISSVIFVNNYAFIILSLAIFGIGLGSIYSYYKIKIVDANLIIKTIVKILLLISVSLFFFILLVTEWSAVTKPLVYFTILIIPFFLVGIVYAQIFKFFVIHSFKLYAADLTGAALGSLLSLATLTLLGAPNTVLLVALIIALSALLFAYNKSNGRLIIPSFFVLLVAIGVLVINGNTELFSKIPIGNFPEKDFHHVYEDAVNRSEIVDSRWSIYGRTDLVQYKHQDVVKQIFIDGAAGSQMYRFNGDISKPEPLLLNLLLRHTTSIPFFFLSDYEKDNMLVIGPGGGKEIIVGLLSYVKRITGVEINPDFVNIVKDYKYYNRGIYTDFPNVDIQVKEGRHYIKQTKNNYDLIVMALPSTEQLQSIDAFAMNENYLLTVEALKDYLNILSNEGLLIFTLHNQWELIRVIVTTLKTFENLGIDNKSALNHFAIIEQEHAPTIVIKKSAFTNNEIIHWQNTIKNIPKELPSVTYLPFTWETLKPSRTNQFLSGLYFDRYTVNKFVKEHQYDISPCYDDSPYFYKINKGVPDDYLWLMIGVAFLNLLVVGIPFIMIKKKSKRKEMKSISLPLIIFICIGLGFMILEISLFQKLILYLGSPTISLSILLCSILVGMGLGSLFGNKLFKDNHYKRLYIITIVIVVTGAILFLFLPFVLNKMLAYNILYRALVTVIVILPFGFLLGIPFPTALQLLRHSETEKYIPWMYGINGTMSVLSSILTVTLSMLIGFTYTFFIGLFFYLLISLVLKQKVFTVRLKNLPASN